MIEVQIVSSVVVIIRIVYVWTCCQIVWICKCFTVPEVIVIPGVCGIAVEALRPEHDFVDVVHTILVIIDVDIITITIIVVVECLRE